MNEFENETSQARRFVLPPIVKPLYRATDPTPLENALAVGIFLCVIAAVIVSMV